MPTEKLAVIPSPKNRAEVIPTSPMPPGLTDPGFQNPEALSQTRACPLTGAVVIVFTSFRLLIDRFPLAIALLPSLRI